MALPDHLRRLDGRPIPDAPGEVRATLVLRNEIVRVASTLNHHRALGVDRFLAVDNGSTDGTREFLEAAPDVHLWATDQSFNASLFGVRWRHALLDAYGVGGWVLNLDADELFIFPGFESARLPALCRFLDEAGAQGVFALMLDMYADRPLAETVHAPGASLIETCPYFDRRPYRVVRHGRFPNSIFGGVRDRLFRDRLGNPGLSPMISKAPLVKWSEQVRYTGAHEITPLRLAEVSGALLHFKFLSDFHARAEEEAARGEHWGEAGEYRAYIALMRTGLTTLMADVSVRYEDSAQLVRMNLMQTSGAWAARAGVAGVTGRPPAETR